MARASLQPGSRPREFLNVILAWLRPILLVLAAFIFLIVILAKLGITLPDQIPLLEQVLPQNPSTFDYRNDLYLFSIKATYQKEPKPKLVLKELDKGEVINQYTKELYQGVVITQYPNEGGFDLSAISKPRLHVWFYYPVSSKPYTECQRYDCCLYPYQPYKPIDCYLIPFIREAEKGSYLDNPQIGIPHLLTINDNLAAGVYIQGIDRKSKQEVRWYEAVLFYNPKLYGIRFVAPLGSPDEEEKEPWTWKQSWPVFEKLINGITFR